MQVKIIEHTKNPLKTIHTAARTCYSSDTPSIIHNNPEINGTLVDTIVNMGHHSVLEHVAITFAIDGISRACSHQLVRHRIASYSQQSQRYVEYDNIDFVIPPSMNKDENIAMGFLKFMEDIEFNYKQLLDLGVEAEDVRYILPNAVATNIVMTVNARELIEMCKLRLCDKAQWEIKKLFSMIKGKIKSNKELSFLEKYLKPKCDWLRYCPEGKRSCGKYSAENGE